MMQRMVDGKTLNVFINKGFEMIDYYFFVGIYLIVGIVSLFLVSKVIPIKNTYLIKTYGDLMGAIVKSFIIWVFWVFIVPAILFEVLKNKPLLWLNKD